MNYKSYDYEIYNKKLIISSIFPQIFCPCSTLSFNFILVYYEYNLIVKLQVLNYKIRWNCRTISINAIIPSVPSILLLQLRDCKVVAQINGRFRSKEKRHTICSYTVQRVYDISIVIQDEDAGFNYLYSQK